MKKILFISFFILIVVGLNATVCVPNHELQEMKAFIKMRADLMDVSISKYLDDYFLQDKVAIDFVRNKYQLPDEDLKDYLKIIIVKRFWVGVMRTLIFIVIILLFYIWAYIQP
jgi:non-ribosomal peptide synthetase component E (peptide arylation enzyme)